MEESTLRDMYERQKLSTYKIAQITGKALSTVRKYLRLYNIPVRTLKERSEAYVKSFGYQPVLHQIIEGELLGDGNIYSRSPVAAVYQHGSKYREYLEWLNSIFNSYGVATSKIYPGKTTNDFKTRTRSYKEFLYYKKRWYPNGIKSVPEDLELTPVVVLHWYLGDGCLLQDGKIQLSTDGFTEEEVLKLADMLSKAVGIKTDTARKRKRIMIYRKGDVSKFLDFIGPCPISVYEYKWTH